MLSFSFDSTIAKLRATSPGKEASMYGPIRDIFVNILGYPAADVDIDTSGEGGRPDITVNATTGLTDSHGRSLNAAWVVVEAKDERGSFMNEASREVIFAQKAKYIGTHTAWFVMIEPDVWVLRPVAGHDVTSGADIVLRLASLSESQFVHELHAMTSDKAGVPPLLKRFREGDLKLIGVEKLVSKDANPSPRESNRVRVSRKRFFQDIREATTQLQTAVAASYGRAKPTVASFTEMAGQFWGAYLKADDSFDAQSLMIRGRPLGPAQSRQHDRDAAKIKRALSKNPYFARLALRGLPDFKARTGVDDDKLDELFSIESANLILARVLLLRFFEDHGFFGPTRYVCNGGVEAFQHMRDYFDESYAQLLERAYKQGSRLYSAAFDPTELDWIFGSDDQNLSNAIEWTLFRFARYDFTTIKGDVLTGIYDRFMDREQRKRLGEFYTPPSIARYIVDRIGINTESHVLDPSCGSGTFLIESYRAMVGDAVDRGAADYEDVLDTLSKIAGNDLNAFSSVLAQIQLLWQVLPLRAQIDSMGFPDILVTGKVNSLVEPDQFARLDRFAEIDISEYDAVVGNPPYVRAERSAQALDARSQEQFAMGRDGFHGVSSKSNAYTLFLYRALDRWCKPADAAGGPGKVGFVLPVSIFDANETDDIRSLFKIGRRWTILEIVDLEVIYRDVFDADVLPVILIAENRPARLEDTVSVRFADESCVRPGLDGTGREFDIAGQTEAIVGYADIWSPDGRVLSRVTPKRLVILRKLWACKTIGDAAKRYWVRKQGSRIVEWTDQIARADSQWDNRRMITSGIAFRRERADGGHFEIYKGENIIACGLQGSPAIANVDLSRVSDNSLWAYADILPAHGFAIAQMALCPSAVRFSTEHQAFTNTATLFFPNDDFLSVPFDMLLLSNVYIWFYALAARMGVLRTLRSHVYPTNFALLPCSPELASHAAEIEAMRGNLLSSCRSSIDSITETGNALTALNLSSFKKHLRSDAGSRVTWAEALESSDSAVQVATPVVSNVTGMFRIQVGAQVFDWLECNAEEIANGLALALQQHVGEEISRAQIFNLPIPVSLEDIKRWNDVLVAYDAPRLESEMRDAIARLDVVVGHCLGLDDGDIAEIQRDLKSDPFLRRIRPRYPGTVTRKQGFRSGLDSERRYQ